MKNLIFVSLANPYNLHGSVVNFITREMRSCIRERFVIFPHGNTNENGQPLTEKDIWNMTLMELADRITDFVRPTDGLRRIPLLKRLHPKSAEKIKNVTTRLKRQVGKVVVATTFPSDDSILDF